MPEWLGCGPGKGGFRSSGGKLGGGSPAFIVAVVTLVGTEEVVDTCVRDEVCDTVRFRGRVMKGDEYTGDGPTTIVRTVRMIHTTVTHELLLILARHRPG